MIKYMKLENNKLLKIYIYLISFWEGDLIDHGVCLTDTVFTAIT